MLWSVAAVIIYYLHSYFLLAQPLICYWLHYTLSHRKSIVALQYNRACVGCYVTVHGLIEVADKEVAKKFVKKLLDDNPFTTAEKIYGYYAKKMSKALDDDLEDYVTCEDYYPPVMEDYHHNGEYALEECCGKLGLKVVMFECDGSMSDFEPDHMRW